MRALCIHAGPLARKHIEKNGLQPSDIGTIPAAAGGPKGLILGPLDRFVFGQWLPQSKQPVHLVGASIGAWRMATACLDDPVAALQQLEHEYIHQHYHVEPGSKRPSAALVSELFGRNIAAFYQGRVAEVLRHPRYKLHIVTARGRHILAREQRLRTPLGYLGAMLTNTVHRKALGAWLERVVFSSPEAALPFATGDYRTRQVALSASNFELALQASCSIPFVLQAIHNIPGAPPGAYWDGGITDYHLHLNYAGVRNTIEKIAGNPLLTSGNGQGSLVLYPHFQSSVVPGWLDKHLKWRYKATHFLDTMVLLSPKAQWVKSLPNGKLPDRNDFMHYGQDLAGRVKAWRAATSASAQLADEFQAWLARPDSAAIAPL